ncbi:hypothetical protein [Kitasatospora cineracea]|uniref:Phosphotransferase family enzyme n=1 Tax=Kitasatospora cineracea TaxID=88074 RepID=A0A8G1UC36_9ACTN|nr:hypothetical protein [Kitasatospora cineracea]ROR38023.1 hypothetical protein EDD39_6186 [Kitasatospora cineracea]
MYSEPEPNTAGRMRSMHTAAAAAFDAAPVGSREAWGWRGRTLSRPVATASGKGWLRLVSAPADRAGGKLWEGPQEAERLMPPAVPRPHLRGRHTWTNGEHGYLAELYDRITVPTITTHEPTLRKAPDLDDAWWDGLSTALDVIAAVPSTRVAVRQEYLDRAMPQYLGVPVDTRLPAWTTAHGDLHWANLTGPALTVLDWEGWGAAPAGYDAALLHSHSLLVPDTAAEIRRRLGSVLDTPAGRFAELVVITELLQTTTRGDNLDLEEPLRHRLSEITG